MALVASCGVLRMVLRLCRPDRLAKRQFRRSSYLLQRNRTWATVCRLSPQLQPGLVTFNTHWQKKKSLNPSCQPTLSSGKLVFELKYRFVKSKSFSSFAGAIVASTRCTEQPRFDVSAKTSYS